jgi:ABC-2 type transport system permease protein
MIPVFRTQWRKDKRNPSTVIAFIIASIVLTLIFSESNQQTKTTVAIFSSEANGNKIEEKWESLLNNNEEISFVITDEETSRKDVEEGNRDIAIQLFANDYKAITATNAQVVQLVQSHVHTVFTEEAHLEAASSLEMETDEIRDYVQGYLDNPPLQINAESLDGGDVSNHNMTVQLLFGFSLFMAMFTIGFKVNAVTTDKVSGIWDRMILSPVSKTGMYAGHLLYSFCIGFLQILVVLVIFNYVMDYDLGNNFGMIVVIAAVFTLSMVSTAMLFTGFIKTPEQFYMIYPSVIPIIPLISGAYMPPGIITNPVLLFIADLFPLKHAMDALMNVAFYDASWNDIALPIVLMFLIGVICMGIGVNLVERRSN